MKVIITQMKAPWPEGAGVGAVVELLGALVLPGWAIGKCTPAPDDAEAQFTAEPAAPADPSGETLAAALTTLEAVPDPRLDAALARLDQVLARHEELAQRLDAIASVIASVGPRVAEAIASASDAVAGKVEAASVEHAAALKAVAGKVDELAAKKTK